MHLKELDLPEDRGGDGSIVSSASSVSRVSRVNIVSSVCSVDIVRFVGNSNTTNK